MRRDLLGLALARPDVASVRSVRFMARPVGKAPVVLVGLRRPRRPPEAPFYLGVTWNLGGGRALQPQAQEAWSRCCCVRAARRALRGAAILSPRGGP